MNIIFSTQSSSLNLFYETSLILKKKLNINKNIFLVSESLYFDNWLKNYPGINKKENIFIKEWEVFNTKCGYDLEVLKNFEKNIGRPGLIDVLLSDRRIFMGHKCTFTQDYKRRFDDETLLCILQQYLLKMENLFNEYKPQVAISFISVTVFDYLLFLFAKSNNTKFINIRPSKIKNLIQISNELCDPSEEIREIFENPSNLDTEDLVFAKHFLNNEINQSGIYEGTIKPSKKPADKFIVKKNIFNTLFLFSKNLHKYYTSPAANDNHCPNPLLIAFYKYFLTPYRAKKVNHYLKNDYVVPKDLGKNEFVFFPLHTEPEVSLLVYSRPFINQIEVIRYLALSLPIGMKLVIKEHPWMIGKRKLSSYKKIRNIPNVLLSSPEISTNDWISQCKLVAVISSSVGQEAAFMGKPVLTFGNCMVNILPQSLVKKVGSLIDLSVDIQNLLNNYKFNKKILINYVASIKKKSYPINLYSSLLERREAFSYSKKIFKDEIKNFASCIFDKIDN